MLSASAHECPRAGASNASGIFSTRARLLSGRAHHLFLRNLLLSLWFPLAELDGLKVPLQGHDSAFFEQPGWEDEAPVTDYGGGPTCFWASLNLTSREFTS